MNTLPRHRRNCPNADCPSHAPGGKPRVIRHSRFRTNRGIRRRLLCKVCGRTFVATLGTPYYRMRKPHRVLDQVAALQSKVLFEEGGREASREEGVPRLMGRTRWLLAEFTLAT